MKTKVAVAMSGGVDSSVAAALLVEEGYDVTGITMQIWPDTPESGGDCGEGCCSLSAVDDARRVADKLGIPYYVMNFRDIFLKKVISYFHTEYLSGRTPNPCIACNRYVKFDALLRKAVAMGMDRIATGHYASVSYDSASGRHLLLKSASGIKDQTYVLYNLNQEQLSRTIFPVGNYDKSQIRDIAGKLGLDVASKPDSQEICFVADNNYGGYIERTSGKSTSSGDFVDKEGNFLGRHKGIIHYTIGQRKGLGISFGKPLFVIGIDTVTNRIILGEESEVFKHDLIAGDLNYIPYEKPAYPARVTAKIRYSAKEAPAELHEEPGRRVRVVFDNPQRAITPGQSVVFYDGDIVVGGGTILE